MAEKGLYRFLWLKYFDFVTASNHWPLASLKGEGVSTTITTLLVIKLAVLF